MRRTLLFALLLPLPLLAVLLALLSMSGTGSRWLIGRLQVAYPDQIRCGAVEGVLVGPLILHDLALAGGGSQLTVERLELDWRPAALLTGHVVLQRIYATGIALDLASDDAPLPVGLFPDLPLPPLPVRLERAEFVAVALRQGNDRWMIDRLSLSGGFDGSGIQLAQAELQMAGQRLEMAGSLAAVTPHRLEGSLHWQGELPQVGTLAAEGTLAGDLADLQLDIRLQAPWNLHLSGAVQPAAGPAFDFVARWQELRWPAGMPYSLSLRPGTLRLGGRADAYRLELESGLQANGLAESQLMLAATGDASSLRAERFNLQSPAGNVTVRGELAWQPQVQFSCEIEATGLDPAAFRSEWEGDLTLAARVSGRAGENERGAWSTGGVVDQLSGTLRGYPLQLSGAFQQEGETLQLDNLQLLSAGNRLTVGGRLDVADLDVAVDIQAPALHSLLPGLEGALHGRGRLRGTFEDPHLEADFTARGLVWSDWRLTGGSLKGGWENAGGNLVLAVDGLQHGEVRLDRGEAILGGELARHELTVDLRGAGRHLALAAGGGWHEQAWQGQVRALRLEGGPEGVWRLRSPVDLQLEPSLMDTRSVLLTGPDGATMEGTLRWSSADGLLANWELRELPLAFLAAFVPGDLDFIGRLSARADLRGTPADLHGSGRISLTGWQLVAPLEGSEPLQLQFGATSLDLALAGDDATLRLQAALPLSGQVQAELAFRPQVESEHALQGELQLELPDIAPLGGFLAQTAGLAGRLTVGARLGGSSRHPLWQGELRMSGLAARLPDLGLTLREGWLDLLAAPGEPPRLAGGLRSGEGELRLDGQLHPGEGFAWPLTLRLSGKNLQVADLPEARVWASPDLQLEAREGAWLLRGSVLVPKAKFSLEDLPEEVVRRSTDETLVDVPAASRGGGLPLDARLRLDLGDDVRLRGFGLSGRLAGSLRAELREGASSLDGQLTLEEGRYDAFGQRLVIEQGRLIFTGPAMDPGLDLRATRPLPDSAVKPYLLVGGRGSAPLITVSSEPPLPEAEALALLLTGRPLKGVGQQEGSAMAEAALALGISRAEPWLRQLGAQFGLDTLEVQSTTGAWGKSAVAVGTYLNPDIYVGYAAGLFDPGGAMLLRLRLTERLELETRAGVHSSADFFYRFERK